MTLKPFKLTLSVLLSLSFTACGIATKSDSQLDGHYEGSSAAKFSAQAGLQRATAEWEDSRGVIISQPLITSFGKTDMAAAILNSGVDKLWIVVPQTSRDTINSSIYANLRRAVGSNVSKIELISQQHAGSLTVWSRDWAPQGALSASGDLRLLDFNYYPNRRADDFTAQSFERLLSYDRVSVPVYNEGGNFMTTTDGFCMMTTRVTDANARAEQADDMILGASEIQSYYQAAAGCQTVKIFPRMPHEGTGHIDMWAKFLSDDTLIVGELRDEVMALYTDKTSYQYALDVKNYLDTRAAEIKRLGFNVVRLPMPGPIFANGVDVFRSYTNSLTVNGSAITPRYVTPGGKDAADASGRYFDSTFRSKYEREVEAVYERYGYAMHWIDSDELIYVGGAVHCTTMQLPR